MKHPEFNLVDVAFGDVSRRNNLRTVEQANPPKGMADCYRTVFRYPPEFAEHVKVNNSVGGYRGPVYADWLPIDIDDKDDLPGAMKQAQRFLQQLEARYDVELSQVRCYFSGAKGLHILLPAEMFGWEPGVDLPERMRQAALMLTDGIKIDTAIYDSVRLFRIENTKHGKTGLYKIPLYANDVLWTEIELIMDLAQEPRTTVEFVEPFPNEALQNLWAGTKQTERPATAATTALAPDKYAKPCIVRMLQGGLKEGENRQAVALRVAVHFRKQGLPGSMILAALQDWNKANVDLLPDKELQHAVEQATSRPYDFGCKDGLTQQFCQGQCPFNKQKTAVQTEQTEQEIRILDLREAQQQYEDYVNLLRTSRVTLGIEPIDKAMRGIAPGEVCWIIARAKVGKTAFLLNILGNNSSQKVDSLFATLEMPAAQVYERSMQIATEQSGQDIESMFLRTILAKESRSALPGEYRLWTQRTWDRFQYVRFVDKDVMDQDEIERAHEAYIKRFGSSPKILAVDYLGRMDGGFGSEYEQISRLAKGSKSLAKRLKVAVIVLHQVSRAGGDGSEPITMDMARGSGQVEEAADFLQGLWRPGKEALAEFEKEMQKVRSGWKLPQLEKGQEFIQNALLLNRRGPPLQTVFLFDKVRMLFKPVEGQRK